MKSLRLRHRVSVAEAGKSLLEVLQGPLSSTLGRAVTRGAVRKLVAVGVVRVNGRSERRPGFRLPSASVVEAAIREEPWLAETAAPKATIPLLYADAHLVAVDKPAGLPTHPTADPRRPSLVRLVEASLRCSLGVHQRLDRDTSGVIVFSRSPEGAAGLARLFADRRVEKVYHALCARPATVESAVFTARERLAPAGKGRMVVARVGGVEAVTSFRILRRGPAALLVEARPITGRKHQVRAQLAARGMPLLGDRAYGGPLRVAGVEAARAMLHARELLLVHPVDGSALRIESPYPGDFAALVERLLTSAGGR